MQSVFNGKRKYLFVQQISCELTREKYIIMIAFQKSQKSRRIIGEIESIYWNYFAWVFINFNLFIEK